LNSQPLNDVTIAVASNNPAEGVTDVSSLTFTAANWNIAQTVTVTGVDDFVDAGDLAYGLLTDSVVSCDPTHNGIDDADVSVTNSDNDTAGITVTPTSSLTTYALSLHDALTIFLNSQPLNDVTIAVASNNPAEGVTDVSSLTFTAANWNIAQTVTVTGVDDFV